MSDAVPPAVEAAPAYLEQVLVFLVAAILVVPLFRRLKASPILGYLLIGMVLGPYALRVVDDPDGVRRLGELGVVFFLFTIGLELSLSRLIALRRYVFGLGAGQVLVTGAALALAAGALGLDAIAAVTVGASLALSSTAVVIQLLVERRAIASRAGRVSVAVLLFQDLAVVPMLMLVSLSREGTAESLGVALGLVVLKALAAVLAIFVIGQVVLRPLYRLVAATRGPELFTGMTILVILATAWATAYAGLSMALGAFLAGVLLSESEFRHQIESDIEPFKGLLLGLFFISVGMGLDFAAAADWALWLGPALVVLLVAKAAILFGLARLFGLTKAQAAETAILLAQAGEFGFVLLAAAAAAGLVPLPLAQFFIILTAISLIFTPVLDGIARRVARRLEVAAAMTGESEDLTSLEGHVVILGYGRVGETVARILKVRRVPFVAIDIDPGRARACRARGDYVFYGDATRDELLRHFNVERAAAAVITLDSALASFRALEAVKRLAPSLPVVVRARDATHADTLMASGATAIAPETFESSLQLSGQVLRALGEPADAINATIERIRSESYAPIAGAGEDARKPDAA